MIRRYGLFLLTLPLAAVLVAAPAAAQYYPSPPPGYTRSAPPPAGYDGDQAAPPAAFWSEDDGDDQPVRRPYRSPRVSQVPQGKGNAADRILPYPDDAEAVPPPGFAPPPGRAPVYGHQFDQQSPAGPDDPNAIRPPGAIGPAQATAPARTAAAAGRRPRHCRRRISRKSAHPKELPPNLRKQMVTLSDQGAGRHHHRRYAEHLSLSGARQRQGDPLRRRRRPRGLHLDRHRAHFQDEGMAGLVSAAGNDRAPALSAARDGGRPGQSARRARPLSRQHALPHPRHQPAVDHRPVCVVGLHRLLNEDVEDLYSRVQVGTRVVVLPGKAPETVAAGAQPPANPMAPPPANPMAPPQHSGTAISGTPLPAAH